MAPPQTDHGELPLAAVIIPILDRERIGVDVERIPSADALGVLMGCLRLVGWTEQTVVQRQFEQLSDVAARVPVVQRRVSRGLRRPNRGSPMQC